MGASVSQCMMGGARVPRSAAALQPLSTGQCWGCQDIAKQKTRRVPSERGTLNEWAQTWAFADPNPSV